VRNFALAISILAMLSISVFSASFSQQATSILVVRLSSDVIDPEGVVSIRISAMLEPNSTKDVMVRFIPPSGSVQQHPLSLQADTLGFASRIIEYPRDVANASTRQAGNYTALVQDMQTGTLVDSTSFEVGAPGDIVSLTEGMSALFYPVIAAVIGAGLTFLYNLLSARRERKVNLDSRKAEYYMKIRGNYLVIASTIYNEANKLESLRKMIDNDTEDIEARYLDCFYYLALFLREDLVVLQKLALISLTT
jgi:hypothetical protein